MQDLRYIYGKIEVTFDELLDVGNIAKKVSFLA